MLALDTAHATTHTDPADLAVWAELLRQAGCDRLLAPASGLVKLVPTARALHAWSGGDLRELVLTHVLAGPAGEWRLALAGNVVRRLPGHPPVVTHARGGCFEWVDTLLQPPSLTLAELLALHAPGALAGWLPLLAGAGPRTLLLGASPQLLAGRWLPRELAQLGCKPTAAPLAARDGLLYLPGR
jgi:hypothetical protein